jgi:hypothetical protein
VKRYSRTDSAIARATRPVSAPAALVCLTEIKAGRITDLSKLKNVRAEVHDRLRFTRTAEGGWLIERLAH